MRDRIRWAESCEFCGQLPKMTNGRASCACPDKCWSCIKSVRGTPGEEARLFQMGFGWKAYVEGGGYYALSNIIIHLYEDGTWDTYSVTKQASLEAFLSELEVIFAAA